MNTSKPLKSLTKSQHKSNSINSSLKSHKSIKLSKSPLHHTTQRHKSTTKQRKSTAFPTQLVQANFNKLLSQSTPFYSSKSISTIPILQTYSQLYPQIANYHHTIRAIHNIQSFAVITSIANHTFDPQKTTLINYPLLSQANPLQMPMYLQALARSSEEVAEIMEELKNGEIASICTNLALEAGIFPLLEDKNNISTQQIDMDTNNNKTTSQQLMFPLKHTKNQLQQRQQHNTQQPIVNTKIVVPRSVQTTIDSTSSTPLQQSNNDKKSIAMPKRRK